MHAAARDRRRWFFGDRCDRTPSGAVEDALYLKMYGKKRRLTTDPYESYVKGGYWPNCWLNPKLQYAERDVDQPLRHRRALAPTKSD